MEIVRQGIFKILTEYETTSLKRYWVTQQLSVKWDISLPSCVWTKKPFHSEGCMPIAGGINTASCGKWLWQVLNEVGLRWDKCGLKNLSTLSAGCGCILQGEQHCLLWQVVVAGRRWVVARHFLQPQASHIWIFPCNIPRQIALPCLSHFLVTVQLYCRAWVELVRFPDPAASGSGNLTRVEAEQVGDKLIRCHLASMHLVRLAGWLAGFHDEILPEADHSLLNSISSDLFSSCLGSSANRGRGKQLSIFLSGSFWPIFSLKTYRLCNPRLCVLVCFVNCKMRASNKGSGMQDTLLSCLALPTLLNRPFFRIL